MDMYRAGLNTWSVASNPPLPEGHQCAPGRAPVWYVVWQSDKESGVVGLPTLTPYPLVGLPQVSAIRLPSDGVQWVCCGWLNTLERCMCVCVCACVRARARTLGVRTCVRDL